MSIKIIKPGIFSTIQDPGRTGHRSKGIGPGGVMDFVAASIANYIAGNENDEAVIEMHYPAAALMFDEEASISITGANFDAHINNAPVSLYQPIIVQKNDLLQFKKFIAGARVYLAVQGGIKADRWLGSYSTNVKVNAGGHFGRALKKDDIIETKIKPASFTDKLFQLDSASLAGVHENTHSVRCIPGAEWQMLTEKCQSIFITNEFIITSQSDRMGYRLAGEAMFLNEAVSLISSSVNFGTVQLLPNGQLIVLMADHQTTGGYPRIANVITADLPKLAQLPVNTKMNFTFVSLQEAEEALLSLHQNLTAIKNSCQQFYGHH